LGGRKTYARDEGRVLASGGNSHVWGTSLMIEIGGDRRTSRWRMGEVKGVGKQRGERRIRRVVRRGEGEGWEWMEEIWRRRGRRAKKREGGGGDESGGGVVGYGRGG